MPANICLLNSSHFSHHRVSFTKLHALTNHNKVVFPNGKIVTLLKQIKLYSFTIMFLFNFGVMHYSQHFLTLSCSPNMPDTLSFSISLLACASSMTSL
ncbi:hypothetical protein CR513_40201, partial [Mucuna pruriens]